jgi:hypothetical protein
MALMLKPIIASRRRVNQSSKASWRVRWHAAVTQRWRSFAHELSGGYRQLHYMRGPGPKWRESMVTPAALNNISLSGRPGHGGCLRSSESGY